MFKPCRFKLGPTLLLIPALIEPWMPVVYCDLLVLAVESTLFVGSPAAPPPRLERLKAAALTCLPIPTVSMGCLIMQVTTRLLEGGWLP